MRKLLLVVLSVFAAVWLLWTFGGKPTHAATTVALAPVPHMQFLSATGAPLTSGCVYTYAAGTTTQLATYTDSTGNTVNSDPIQLDAGGFANVWLTGSAYKFAVYANPNGGMCPGTPGGTLVLQWTVDNITTATGSGGGGAATSLTSASANPASAGIIRMAKSDTVCWRNAGNSGNLCVSLDANNILTWAGGSLAMTEIAAPSGVAGEDIIWADNTAHRWKVSNNGGAAVQLVVSGADINTSDQVTVTHLASPLPVAQGGTGVASVSGSGNPCYTTSCSLNSPAIVTPAITEPTINQGIANNGTGLQHVRSSACSAAISCTVSWPTSFADTSYTVTCSATTGSSNSPYVFLGSKTAAGVTVIIADGIAAANTVTPEVDCIAIHD